MLPRADHALAVGFAALGVNGKRVGGTVAIDTAGHVFDTTNGCGVAIDVIPGCVSIEDCG